MAFLASCTLIKPEKFNANNAVECQICLWILGFFCNVDQNLKAQCFLSGHFRKQKCTSTGSKSDGLRLVIAGFCLKFFQGCALAEPGGPWHLTFALGRLENLNFSNKSYAGHPRFYSFRALGSFSFP